MGIGDFRHVVMFQVPHTEPDGYGGTLEVWTDLPPVWNVDIRPATVRDLERQTAGTTVATATHVVYGWYRDDVTVKCRFIFDGDEFRITGIATPQMRKIHQFLFALQTV